MPKTKSTSRKPSAKQLQAAEKQKNLEALTQLRLDGDYPATLLALAERAGMTVENTSKLISTKGLKEQLVQLDIADTSLVVFKDDADRLAADVRVLNFFASKVLAKRVMEGKPLRADLNKFVSDAKAPTNLKVALKLVLEDRLKQNDMPPPIAELLAPPIPTSQQIATRLIDVLKSQREASAESYPVSINRLLELADFAQLPSTTCTKSLKDSIFADRVSYCGPRIGDVSKSKTCILKADLKPLLPKLAQRAFEYAIAMPSQAGKMQKGAKSVAVPATTTIFSPAALGQAMLVAKADRELFAAQFVDLVDSAEPLLAVGWLEIKGERHFFRVADAHFVGTTGSLRSAGSQTPISVQSETSSKFAADFDAAFRRIDARGGNRNFVKVYDLREALSQYDRTAFEVGLRRLREANQYTMDSAQGGFSPLNEAERRAGIQEGSSLLVYVTRKC